MRILDFAIKQEIQKGLLTPIICPQSDLLSAVLENSFSKAIPDFPKTAERKEILGRFFWPYNLFLAFIINGKLEIWILKS